jgi:hypothetical protein
MNTKCFSDLEAWMQGVVDQVKAITGTTVLLSLDCWGTHNGPTELRGSSIWTDTPNRHYYFENYQELCDIVAGFERLPLLYRRFEL